MNYLCFMDFDGTLTTNSKDISFEGIQLLKSYLKENKMCIISEESYDNLLKYINKNDIDCDIASISSSKAKIDNKVYFYTISKDIINDIILNIKEGIYTSFGETISNKFVINYQKRLEFFYPKNYKMMDTFNEDILSITIALQNEYSSLLKDLLDKNNLYYETIGKDLKREIIRIKKEKFDKSNISLKLKNIYKNYTTIAITDSINDKDMFLNSDITVAMTNGDSKIKEMAQYITEFDSNNLGAIKMLDYISHLK